MGSDDSFLPRILSVFYAVLDVKIGSRIVYQVPEGLISVSRQDPALLSTSTSFSLPLQSTTSLGELSNSILTESPSPSPNDFGSSQVSPFKEDYTSLSISSPPKRALSTSTQRKLFYFEDISKYVIPAAPLCGRLVKCTTRNNRIIGFPVELHDAKRYERGVFQYNCCFVFDKAADLSCYEPIVRKVGRVLTACEEESGFLSSPSTCENMHAIIEQLYEDLNSYAETSIAIDQFNSIELKLFPFYPNPPPVNDWDVPLTLIDLKKIRDSNWDLTMVKICDLIDGVNHVSRIAHLAECDKELARQALSHLLFYQVILMIDIFQYSNMYTLRKSIQWLADAPHVMEECGPYAVRYGKMPPDWPKLLHLYSRLKPGKTVLEWMHEYEVHTLDIDVRRFLSFGVIKGFLRRVHRYPILLPDAGPTTTQAQGRPRTYSITSVGRQRGRSFNTTNDSPGTDWAFQTAPPRQPSPDRGRDRKTDTASVLNAPAHSTSTSGDASAQRAPNKSTSILPPSLSSLSLRTFATHTSERRASAAEAALEQLRSRSVVRESRASSPAPPPVPPSSPRLSRTQRPRGITHDEHMRAQGQRPDNKRRSMTPSSFLPSTPPGPVSVMDTRRSIAGGGARRGSGAGLWPPEQGINRRRVESDGAMEDGRSRALATVADATKSSRPRFERSPSAPVSRQTSTASVGGHPIPQPDAAGRTEYSPFPKRILSFLDGEHHEDELGTEFQAGWPLLERWLVEAGGGTGDGDFGRVAFIYR